jgi:hypothetical protein
MGYDDFGSLRSFTMTEREQIEQQIRELLASETHAIPLSNKLFSPNGLFNRLATTEEERRAVAQSALFKDALRRLSELQKKESAEFASAVQQAEAVVPGEGYLFKLERAESA